MTTDYEHITHAIYKFGKKVSRNFFCRADAELSLAGFIKQSIFNASEFEIKEVPVEITIKRADLEMMIKKGRMPSGTSNGMKDTEYNILAMSSHCLIKHIEGLLND